MLKGINPILSPDALHVIASMGHGDELLIADGNYPAANTARRLVRFDGHGIPAILSGLLDLFPLDSFAACPVVLMDVPADVDNPPVWEEYKSIITKKDVIFNATNEGRSWKDGVEYAERFAFYGRGDGCFAVFASGETALYANIILKKGILKPEEIRQ